MTRHETLRKVMMDDAALVRLYLLAGQPHCARLVLESGSSPASTSAALAEVSRFSRLGSNAPTASTAWTALRLPPKLGGTHAHAAWVCVEAVREAGGVVEDVEDGEVRTAVAAADVVRLAEAEAEVETDATTMAAQGAASSLEEYVEQAERVMRRVVRSEDGRAFDAVVAVVEKLGDRVARGREEAVAELVRLGREEGRLECVVKAVALSLVAGTLAAEVEEEVARVARERGSEDALRVVVGGAALAGSASAPRHAKEMRERLVRACSLAGSSAPSAFESLARALEGPVPAPPRDDDDEEDVDEELATPTSLTALVVQALMRRSPDAPPKPPSLSLETEDEYRAAIVRAFGALDADAAVARPQQLQPPSLARRFARDFKLR